MEFPDTPNPGSDEEVFKPVTGFEDRYEVSNLGNVKSLRYRGIDGNEAILSNRWVTTDRNNGRYATVRLMDSRSEKDEQYRVHRLVAKEFVPNPEGKSEVNHTDGDTENNHASNLEWCTRSENQKHAIENGLAEPPESPNPKNSGEKYGWENDDGRVFYGTPSELHREYPDGPGMSHLYKVVNEDYPSNKSCKGWRVVDIPNPGSDKAIEMGGTCPVLDNGHGKGSYLGDFIVSMDCPLHAEEPC